jgi:hypothetical protein
MADNRGVVYMGSGAVEVQPPGTPTVPRLDAERLQGVALGGQVLRLGGDAGVADLERGHAPNCVPFVGRSPAHITEPPLRHTPPWLGTDDPAQRDGCAGGGSACETRLRRERRRSRCRGFSTRRFRHPHG